MKSCTYLYSSIPRQPPLTDAGKSSLIQDTYSIDVNTRRNIFMTKDNDMIDKKNRILIVDHDTHILQMIQYILEMEGYEVSTAQSGKAVLSLIKEVNPSLVLLNLLMPDMEGIDICRNIRQFSQIPILMVKDQGFDEKVKGINLGEDEFIIKPFSAQVLVARISAVIHEESPHNTVSDMIIKCRGGLKIDLIKKLVTIRNEIVDLSSTEYRILALLAMNGDRVVSREEILAEVWTDVSQNNVHLLQVNIGRLRDKLKDDVKGNRYIETKHGVGYYLTCRGLKPKS